jgi:FtsP/CotA-like multicopper oxidase with cupredoxin domain
VAQPDQLTADSPITPPRILRRQPHPFQVVARRGDSPGPFDTGWNDTVDLSPSESVEVAVRFTDYPGRYLLHCHNLEHEDMAMMAAFQTS